MSKTKIEWCDYTVNPVKGKCPVACPYCYARRMYDRFKWNPEIKYLSIDKVNSDISTIDNARGSAGLNKRIFVGSTMELFGEWVAEDYLRQLFTVITGWPEHTFIFLTKRPENLIKWSPFPPNCWVGFSATDSNSCLHGLLQMRDSVKAAVKFISLEPLLGEIPFTGEEYQAAGISWVIIGQQTPANYKTAPKEIWIQQIRDSCDKVQIPYFLKENLRILPHAILDYHADFPA